MQEPNKTAKDLALQNRVNQVLQDPFAALLPTEYRIVLVPFWLEKKAHLGDGVEIAMMVKRWIETLGLTVEDLKQGIVDCGILSNQEFQEFPTGTMKQFNDAVMTIINRRQRLEEQMRRRPDYWPGETPKPNGKHKPRHQHAEHPFPPSRVSSDVPIHEQVVTKLAESFRMGEYIEPKRRIDCTEDELHG